MKRLISFLLLFSFFGESVIALNISKAIVDSYSINLRNSPDLSSKVVKTLKKWAVVKIEWNLSDKFVKVIFTWKDKKEYSWYAVSKFFSQVIEIPVIPIDPKIKERQSWKISSKILNSSNFKNTVFPYSFSILSYKPLEKSPDSKDIVIKNSYSNLLKYYNVLFELYKQDKQKAILKDLRLNDEFIKQTWDVLKNITSYVNYLNSLDRDVNILWNGSYEWIISSPKTCIIWYTNLELWWMNAPVWMKYFDLPKIDFNKKNNTLFFALIDDKVLSPKDQKTCEVQITKRFKDKEFIQKTLLQK